MKKYAILTSVLALAACHDGGSHHGGSGGVTPKPVVPAIDMPAGVQSWNSGAGSANAVSNVSDVFTFTIDGSGNIENILHDGKTYRRNGTNNEYVYTEPDETEKINLATLGKSAGLSYADFGYAMETELKPDSTERDFYVFTGGNIAKEIKAPDVKDATYRGTAVAYVESDMNGRIVNKVTQTGDASLVFDNAGNHTLTMPFSQAENPWYDVVVKNGGAANATIALSGGENVDADFQVTESMLNNMSDVYYSKQFYGDAGDATEVVYRVGFEAKDRVVDREIEFDGAFGGKRQ